MFLQSPHIYLSKYTSPHPRRPSSPRSPRTPQMSLSFLLCFTRTEKLSHPEIGAPGSSEMLHPHIELHGMSRLQTSSHSNPLSPLCCCTPASIGLDSPAKHSCRRSGRTMRRNDAVRAGRGASQVSFYKRQNVLTS